ncbi:membrane protein, partial [Streptomyces platensis subsp. clarensis]|nr:membrane protein [Streptomyces platensis subsp. clarensis]
MNNSPGWASPGSTPSDEPARGTQEQPTQADQTSPAGQSSPPNWSKEQPPAGQWSRATSPGYGGPGWGGAPGPGNQPPWGGAWAPTPQAAKPGVIPLRPLAVGEILDGAVTTMRAHWRTVLGISLIVAVVSQTAITVVTGLWFQGADRAPSLSSENIPPLRETMREVGNSLAATGI